MPAGLRVIISSPVDEPFAYSMAIRTAARNIPGGVNAR